MLFPIYLKDKYNIMLEEEKHMPSFKKIFNEILNEERKTLKEVSIKQDIIDNLQENFKIFNVASRGVSVINEKNGFDALISIEGSAEPIKFHIPYGTIVFNKYDTNALNIKPIKEQPQMQTEKLMGYYRLDGTTYRDLGKDRPIENILPNYVTDNYFIQINHNSKVKDVTKIDIQNDKTVGSFSIQQTVYNIKQNAENKYYYTTGTGTASKNIFFIANRPNLPEIEGKKINLYDIIIISPRAYESLKSTVKEVVEPFLFLVTGEVNLPAGIQSTPIESKEPVVNDQQINQQAHTESLKRFLYTKLLKEDDSSTSKITYTVVGPVMLEGLSASHMNEFIQRNVPVKISLTQTVAKKAAETVKSGIKSAPGAIADAVSGKDVKGVELGSTGALLDKMKQGIVNSVSGNK